MFAVPYCAVYVWANVRAHCAFFVLLIRFIIASAWSVKWTNKCWWWWRWWWWWIRHWWVSSWWISCRLHGRGQFVVRACTRVAASWIAAERQSVVRRCRINSPAHSSIKRRELSWCIHVCVNVAVLSDHCCQSSASFPCHSCFCASHIYVTYTRLRYVTFCAVAYIEHYGILKLFCTKMPTVCKMYIKIQKDRHWQWHVNQYY